MHSIISDKEVFEALKEHKRTGLYVSHHAMEAWLKTWGTNQEKFCSDLASK